MEKEGKSEVHITNNFNAPIGQHIDHVDTINFRMDGDGTFHFGMVEKANGTPREDHGNAEGRDEERFHFVHPELDEEEAWKIHDAVKRYVATNKVIDICNYLKELKDRGKIMLPQSPSDAYHELVRMGMPNGEGFGEKHFSAKYKR